MPRSKLSIPRLHKPSGQASIRLDGREIYLGRFGSPEATKAYDELIASWLANVRKLPPQAERPRIPAQPPALTVSGLILEYWGHAQSYYRDADGEPTHEQDNIRLALRPVRKMFGSIAAASFGSMELAEVRKAMISSGLCRNTINARCSKIRQAFKWGASRGLVPLATYELLRTLEPLRPGRGACETEPVEPVSLVDYRAALARMTGPVAAAIEVLFYTGARLGEILSMCRGDLVERDGMLHFTPRRHKLTHKRKGRSIILVPHPR